ncbi:hypothetical protein QBC33DRAFT_564330 [Phialemonium atrogriseum]|uniref:Uncharacterized protein n=1 Tax=Phialemonium atrogriseum TaxID=1093897 RepID=A0AAJ0BPD9_9PEZI|nr:uncharacterized protein QBC33DRAFT_564330 [Phialemonium atrogriseum]KAK1761881.1 hypothetical protein QBC33DRAFT_564330 [Phialemonium atrogriseum]
MVDVLTGVLSTVAALFFYTVFVIHLVVVRTTEEILKLVPNELRGAALDEQGSGAKPRSYSQLHWQAQADYVPDQMWDAALTLIMIVMIVMIFNLIAWLIGGFNKVSMLRTLNRMHEEIAGARVQGKVALDGEDIYAVPSTPSTSVAPSAWCSSG